MRLGEGWKSYMQATRDAAFELAREGRIHVLQGGSVVPVAKLPVGGIMRLRIAE